MNDAKTPVERFTHHRSLDGLRGLAVAAVVLYHFAPHLIPGGFLGVDVFFVLSGFLITSLVIAEFGSDGAVSIRSFWTRRARRLLPAALAVIATSVAMAWFLEPTSSRSAIRTQSLASLFYVNNWSAIANGSSYESRFGHDLPLSHFWSLAVEEQFYIVFPLVIVGLLVLLRRVGPHKVVRSRSHPPIKLARLLLIISTLGAAASVALMMVLHTANTDPSRVYFGSDTRVHALLIGVAAACLNVMRPSHVSRNARSRFSLSGFGFSALVVLIVAFVLVEFRQDWLYEGGLAAIALLTAMIIWWVVRSPGHLLDRVLSHRWLVQLGLVSYGIYLWHWPARAFITTERTGLGGVVLFAVRVIATAAATGISLIVIERPFRNSGTDEPSGRSRSLTTGQTLAVFGTMLTTALLCVALTIDHVPVGSTAVAVAPSLAAETQSAGPIRVLLTGDSVAWTLGGGNFAFPQPSTYISPFDSNSVVLWNRARFGTALLRWPKRHDGVISDDCPSCEPAADWPSSVDQFHPDLVVYSASLWDSYDVKVDGRWLSFGSTEFDSAYTAALEQLRDSITSESSHLVLLVQPIPGNYPSDWAKQYTQDSSTFPHINELLRQFASTHADVGLIDLDHWLCPEGICRTTDGEDHKLRLDGLHFTSAGTAFVAPFLTEQFNAILRTETSGTD